MISLSRPLASVFVVALGFASVGCRASSEPPAQAGANAATAAAPEAVACPKCETTWVKVPQKNQKGHVVGYSAANKMVCPDCTSAARRFFSTGKLEHACATCGGEMQRCEAHSGL